MIKGLGNKTHEEKQKRGASSAYRISLEPKLEKSFQLEDSSHV